MGTGSNRRRAVNASQSTFLKVETASEKLLREAPATERPSARLEKLGPAALSVAELLHIALGVTDPLLPLRLLGRWHTPAEMAHASREELGRVKGMTRHRLAQLQAALELARRAQAATEDRPRIKSPADLAHLLLPEMNGLEREEFRVVLLNNQNRVLGQHVVYQGSIHTTVVRIAEVFTEAVRANATGIIVAHNHPSGGDVSPEDIAMTRELVQAGKLLDITVLDHLVIRNQTYVSLKERGIF